MINVEVTKNGNESTAGLLRRFTRRVQESGVLPRVRGLRYFSRSNSPLVSKKRKLKALGRRAQYQELLKLGKVTERREAPRGNRR